MSKVLAPTNTITVRKNAGADVGTRPRLNFSEGANVTLTITDDAPGAEIDIDIASAGGAAPGWLDGYWPAVDPNASYGTYPAIRLPDEAQTVVYQSIIIPGDIATITRAVVLVIPEGTGNIRREVATNFAQACANEDYQTHTDSIAAGQVAVDNGQVECLDITAALTGAVGLDMVGVQFTRHGDNVNDTVGADVYYLGILIQGNP